ncbi:MAG: LysR family substrate-binding domain-containing protein, partial [Rhodoglobus sp.]
MTEPFVVAFVVGVTPAKWARVWGERMPQVPLELRPSSAADAVAALHDGSADVALLRVEGVDDGLSAIRLYEEQPVIVAPKDHVLEALDSVTMADLAGENVVDDIELVAASVGVAIMPQSVARAHSRRDVIARPLTDAPTTTIALVWPTGRTTPLVDEFIGIVRGRTANSSRGAVDEPPPPTPKPARKPPVAAKKPPKFPNRRPGRTR